VNVVSGGKSAKAKHPRRQWRARSLNFADVSLRVVSPRVPHYSFPRTSGGKDSSVGRRISLVPDSGRRPTRDEQGNLVPWCGINIDIDDRKRAEQKIGQNEEDLRTITDAIACPSWSPGLRDRVLALGIRRYCPNGLADIAVVSVPDWLKTRASNSCNALLRREWMLRERAEAQPACPNATDSIMSDRTQTAPASVCPIAYSSTLVDTIIRHGRKRRF